jgi:hypothetical protein
LVYFTLKTGTAATTGNIVVILRHEPIKNAEGVASGDITNAGGATDAQIIPCSSGEISSSI